MKQEQKYKYKRPRLSKIRGWKNKHRAEVKISDITVDAFRLHTFNKTYYVSRDVFAWFLGASHREIQDVVLFPCGCDSPSDCDCNTDHPGDHFRWESLDIDLCTSDFEHPEERHVYQAASAYRKRYFKQQEENK